jgi:hypothetical protein
MSDTIVTTAGLTSFHAVLLNQITNETHTATVEIETQDGEHFMPAILAKLLSDAEDRDVTLEELATNEDLQVWECLLCVQGGEVIIQHNVDKPTESPNPPEVEFAMHDESSLVLLMNADDGDLSGIYKDCLEAERANPNGGGGIIDLRYLETFKRHVWKGGPEEPSRDVIASSYFYLVNRYKVWKAVNGL